MRLILIIGTVLGIVNTCIGQIQKDSFFIRKMKEPGVKLIPVYQGKYKVFTQKIGNGKIKLLLLHGGPANTHEYFENFPDNFKNTGIEIYYYDQLGSYYSDQPNDSTIWNVNRFVDEVEEVRKGLNLNNFYILGHSWGGMLAELYAAKYPDNLLAVIISNVPVVVKDTSKLRLNAKMISERWNSHIRSLPEFNKYSENIFDSIAKPTPLCDTILFNKLRTIYISKRDSLIQSTNYRLPVRPEPLQRNLSHINRKDRVQMKGFDQNYLNAVGSIKCPVLLIGGNFDRMGQELYPEMKSHFINAKTRVYICPNGSHFSMWDDSPNYFREVIRFIKDVDSNSFDPDK